MDHKRLFHNSITSKRESWITIFGLLRRNDDRWRHSDDSYFWVFFYKFQNVIFQFRKDENNWTCRLEKNPDFLIGPNIEQILKSKEYP